MGILLTALRRPPAQARVNIPIMHDDQHGTAIIAGAGLINALEFAGKNIADIKVCNFSSCFYWRLEVLAVGKLCGARM